ncbi:hypothetical protein OAO55_01055 [Bacteroidales bacterium]|nr:hypothetical protein [Bacteroidales bacterium]
MINKEIINWLLEGDISIQYQVHRDLLHDSIPELQNRIANEGWGEQFMAQRKPNGHWGIAFYQPKWISSHYTLLDLRNLCISPNIQRISESIEKILRNDKGHDGGINPSGTVNKSDVCINGMFMNYACYFRASEELLKSVVDFVLSQQLPDGGFNCKFNRSGARHSSLHSTISVLEGFFEYRKQGYMYRLEEIQKMESESREFILQHRLFKSDKTGKIIDKRMLILSYPSRWRYDILRAMDYFQYSGCPYDKRMDDAIDVITKKQRKDKTWPLQAKHPGRTHFDMEKGGFPSRWNTLRALRVLKHFDLLHPQK